LNSLAAKITLAYALELIDNITRSRLTVARKVRNEFAHAAYLITFQHPEIRRLLDQFPPDCDTGAKNELLYMWHLGQVESHLVSVAGPDILKSSGASATKA
jgi:hypothetical protein